MLTEDQVKTGKVAYILSVDCNGLFQPERVWVRDYDPSSKVPVTVVRSILIGELVEKVAVRRELSELFGSKQDVVVAAIDRTFECVARHQRQCLQLLAMILPCKDRS